MTISKLTTVTTVLLGLAVVGCSDDGNNDVPGGTVTFELEVIEFVPDVADVAIEGVEICVIDTTNCEMTNANGLATLTLPANSEVTLRIDKSGYAPTVSPQTTKDLDVTGIRTAVLSDATSALMAGVLGTAYPLGDTGVIAISALTDPATADDNGIAGVTFALAQEPTYYLDENGFPSFDLSATTSPDGVGGYIELPPGVHEITVGGTASNCNLLSAWPGTTEDSIRLPVAAGAFTQAFIVCDAVATP